MRNSGKNLTRHLSKENANIRDTIVQTTVLGVVVHIPQHGYDHPDKISDFNCLDGHEDEAEAQKALITWARKYFKQHPDDLGESTLKNALDEISDDLEENGYAAWRTSNDDSCCPVLIFRISKRPLHIKKESDMRYYGVEQPCHGHVYRWIFDEETVSREMLDGGNVPSDIYLDMCWPIGGSNSSSTWVILLDGESEIAGFLSGTPGCEYEDPTLCDIAEFYKTVDCDRGSCTSYWFQKLGLTEKECETDDDAENHRKKAEEMIKALTAFESSVNHLRYPKYDDLYLLDYRNPFYGLSRDMRFSKLEELYKKFCSKEVGV